MKVLSIILPMIGERHPKYMEMFIASLAAWNSDAIKDIQILIVRQKKTDHKADLCFSMTRSCGIDSIIIEPDHPHVESRPVWDTLAEWRACWPHIKGTWINTSHSECIWLRGRLGKTIEYLKEHNPNLALGNLRRIMDRSVARQVLDKLSENFDPEYAESIKSSHWSWWSPEPVPSADAPWEEDLFFSKKEWLENWKMPFLCDGLPYQDVFDLMGRSMREVKYGPIHRMSRDVSSHLHLWHPKGYYQFSPQIRDWFLEDPRWSGTQYHNKELWDRLINDRENVDDCNRKNMVQLRHGPGGSTARYVEAVRQNLKEGTIAFS